MKKEYLFVLLLGMCGILQAQDNHQQKTSKSEKLVQIDMDFGANVNLASAKAGNILDMMTKKRPVFPSLGIRLHHFFSPKWGWYANFRLNMDGGYKKDCFTELSRELEADYYIKNREVEKHNPETSYYLDAGVAYRFENSRWAFYPRLGIGVNNISCQPVSFEIKGKGNNELHRIEYGYKEWYGAESLDLFILSAGFNVNYKLTRSCYLLFGVNYIQPIGKNTYIKCVTDLYTNEVNKEASCRNSTLGRNLNMSVGIGFPIYSNKNKKNKVKTTHRERMRKAMEQQRESFNLFPGNKH